MPGNKKKHRFIDKKSAISFQLVHRSQQDPLLADENAPKHVLVTDSVVRDAKTTKKETLASYGIAFDDDYDYAQHLKDTGEFHKVEPDAEFFTVEARAMKVQLPNVVFPSKREDRTGLLNRGASSGPKVDWDPDIVAALDSDFDDDDPDNQLDDDFVIMANRSSDEIQSDNDMMDDSKTENVGNAIKDKWIQEHLIQKFDTGNIDKQEYSSGELYMSDEACDSVDSLPDFEEEETKSRFTNYSMSSSVICRNAGLTLVDDRFEQLYAEYDDDELGALHHEDVDGKVSTSGPLMENLLQEFEAQEIKRKVKPDLVSGAKDVKVESEFESDEEMERIEVDVVPEQKWDCESILSTYSNLYNHPKLIAEPWKKKNGHIELTKRLGIPVNSLPQRGLTRKQIEELEREGVSSLNITTTRNKNETSEEKRARKAMVKDDRKLRRMEKKNTKMAFKSEEALQKKEQMQAKNNLRGKQIV